MTFEDLSLWQQGIALLGSASLLYALWFLSKKKRSKTKLSSIGKTEVLSNNVEAKSATETTSEQHHQAPAFSSSQGKFWAALSKTRSRFWGLITPDKESLREQLEESWILSDLGVQNTQELLETLQWGDVEGSTPDQRLHSALQQSVKTLESWLPPNLSETWPNAPKEGPCVIWFVGVNGVGKTTSIAKLASELKNKGHSVLLAAGDTFRAAASEQLDTWAQRLGVPIVKGQVGADSSSVLFDAVTSAKAQGIQFVLCDSAGRLHNQGQLMEALAKNKRSLDKALPGAPHETLLVLDAHTGSNMLAQANQFQKSVAVTGLVLTKLDGTAKGGAIVAVMRQTGLPVRRIGLGEGTEDMEAFSAQEFCRALVGLNQA